MLYILHMMCIKWKHSGYIMLIRIHTSSPELLKRFQSHIVVYIKNYLVKLTIVLIIHNTIQNPTRNSNKLCQTPQSQPTIQILIPIITICGILGIFNGRWEKELAKSCMYRTLILNISQTYQH
jgi:hypothetical protein